MSTGRSRTKGRASRAPEEMPTRSTPTSVSDRRRSARRSPVRLPDHLAPIEVEPRRVAPPLTREQAAELLGVHPRTLDRWARLGRISVIDLGGTVRVRVDEAQRLRCAPSSRPA